MTSFTRATHGRETAGARMPTLWDRLWDPETVPTYWLTRFAILRLLGLVYFIAFWTLVHQGLPLLGTHGLLPLADYLDRVAETAGSTTGGLLRAPSLFWLSSSDGLLLAEALIDPP